MFQSTGNFSRRLEMTNSLMQWAMYGAQCDWLDSVQNTKTNILFHFYDYITSWLVHYFSMKSQQFVCFLQDSVFPRYSNSAVARNRNGKRTNDCKRTNLCKKKATALEINYIWTRNNKVDQLLNKTDTKLVRRVSQRPHQSTLQTSVRDNS